MMLMYDSPNDERLDEKGVYIILFREENKEDSP